MIGGRFSRAWPALCVLPVAFLVLLETATAQAPATREWFPAIENKRWNEVASSRRIADNSGTILRMLARMETIAPELWEAVVDPPGSLDLSQLSRAPEGYSGMAVRIEGNTEKVSRITLDEALRDSFEVERLYAVECMVNPDQKALVICHKLPQLWQKDSEIAETFACNSIFLTGTVDRVPVFVSPWIEWYPNADSPMVQAGKATGHLVPLAEAGMDVALFDQIVHNTNVAFLSSESKCFANLLAATKEMESGTNVDMTAPNFPLIEALKDPANHMGRLYLIDGRVRRITKVQIESAALQAKLGQDHYFHVDLFLPLGKVGIEVGDAEGKRISVYGSYGTTLLLLTIPEGMQEASEVDGQRWKLNAMFLKTWQHKTVDSREVSRTLRRPNPILIGLASTAKPVAISKEPDNSISWAITGFWLGLLVLVGGLLLWQKKSS